MSYLTSHVPITMYETISGNTELTFNPPQAAGQTFLRGTPVSLNANGFSQAWDGTTLTGNRGSIYGISNENAANLAVAGAGYPANFGQQGPPWANFTGGAAPNQPSSVTIPYGSPLVTGGTLTMLAVPDTLFTAQADTSDVGATITAGSVSSATPAVLSATATNTHYVGEVLVLSGFTGAGAPLNGLQVTVATASGSAYTATLPLSYTGGAIGSTGAGADTPGPTSPTQAAVGNQYGLSIDSSGTWFIDFFKTTVGTNTCVRIIALYPGDILQTTPFTEVTNGLLVFQFTSVVAP